MESISTQPTPSDNNSARVQRPDLVDLYDRVCFAAGYRTTSPTAIDAGMGQVEEWVAAGLDFDTVVIPAIETVMAGSSERTRTLGRFRSAVATEAAKASKAARSGKAHVPAVPPLLEPEGEDAAFRPVRSALLERLGASGYVAVMNRVRFEAVAVEFDDDRSPARLTGAAHDVGHAMSQSDKIRPVLKAHGFNELW